MTTSSLYDYDQLRTISTADVCGYKAVHQHNPNLVADVIAERNRRRMVKEVNERIWS